MYNIDKLFILVLNFIIFYTFTDSDANLNNFSPFDVKRKKKGMENFLKTEKRLLQMEINEMPFSSNNFYT